MTHDEAVAHIDRWYRYGDRSICVTRVVFDAYASGLSVTGFLYSSGTSVECVRLGLFYKTAYVYTNEGLQR